MVCISSKVKKTIEIARKSIEEGNCVVIGMQSTGEARTKAVKLDLKIVY